MYNVIMQFEVPQFIEIEDKIFGPLTWRQFLYVGGGVGMGVVLFITTNWIIFILIGLPLALLAGALAFYPVNNRPFSYFLEALVTYLNGHKLYLWKQRREIIHKQSFAPKQFSHPHPPTSSHRPNQKNLNSMARKLELEALQKKE